mmetsp:Transcript_56225/g.156585  ORF Transcript_56225/g.156585 Transcript_56225/m.156585 type:complete len:173 (-) Transcript_56225:190-708(-)
MKRSASADSAVVASMQALPHFGLVSARWPKMRCLSFAAEGDLQPVRRGRLDGPGRPAKRRCPDVLDRLEDDVRWLRSGASGGCSQVRRTPTSKRLSDALETVAYTTWRDEPKRLKSWRKTGRPLAWAEVETMRQENLQELRCLFPHAPVELLDMAMKAWCMDEALDVVIAGL